MADSLHNHRRIGFTVTGDVQGVGFRAFTRDRAAGLGLTGWVRNTWDGRVEGEAEGPDHALRELALLLERGPISSHVETLAVRDLPPLGEKGPFRIAR